MSELVKVQEELAEADAVLAGLLAEKEAMLEALAAKKSEIMAANAVRDPLRLQEMSILKAQGPSQVIGDENG